MTRENEWYVPKFGGERFRAFVGMAFLPYTLMCASYSIIGSMFSPVIHWERVFVIFILYILGVGIAAHALDARAPNKPWGRYLSDRALLMIAISTVVVIVIIGAYYAMQVPLLWVFGIVEIFFLFAYNMELFHGKLHTDLWFAFSWGYLPVVAGYVMQTNEVSIDILLIGLFGFFTAFIETNASRPYRGLKVQGNAYPTPSAERQEFERRYELILKSIVATVVILAVALVIFRL